MSEPLAGLGLLVLTLVAAWGGAAQRQLEVLVLVLGRRYALLAAAVLSALVSSALHAWVGQVSGAHLLANWRNEAAGLVLVWAAIGLVRVRHPKPVIEPTFSLGAITLALTIRQIGAPAGLFVLAAVLAGMPLPIAVAAGAAGVTAPSLFGGTSNAEAASDDAGFKWCRILALIVLSTAIYIGFVAQ